MDYKSVLAALTIMCTTLSSHAGDLLTGDKIKELFSNKTCDIEKVDVSNEDKKYLTAFTSADGKRLVYIPWKDKQSKRTWWVEGDKFCASHPKRDDFCRNIKDAGNGVYHSLDNGTHLRTLSNCRDGNQL